MSWQRDRETFCPRERIELRTRLGSLRTRFCLFALRSCLYKKLLFYTCPLPKSLQSLEFSLVLRTKFPTRATHITYHSTATTPSPFIMACHFPVLLLTRIIELLFSLIVLAGSSESKIYSFSAAFTGFSMLMPPHSCSEDSRSSSVRG